MRVRARTYSHFFPGLTELIGIELIASEQRISQTQTARERERERSLPARASAREQRDERFARRTERSTKRGKCPRKSSVEKKTRDKGRKESERARVRTVGGRSRAAAEHESTRAGGRDGDGGDTLVRRGERAQSRATDTLLSSSFIFDAAQQ